MIQVKGFIGTSFIDWDGKISSVIFLAGCNFRCPFCQNFILIENPSSLETVPLQTILEDLEKKRNWIDGIVITGGEPTLYPEFPDFVKNFKKEGFLVKLDTNGSKPEMLQALLKEGLVDYVAMDIKAPLSKYDEACGLKVDTQAIKESINLLLKVEIEGFDYEFRTTLVPNLLMPEDIEEIAKLIKGAKRFVLQQFVPEHAWKEDFRKVKPFDQTQIDRMLKLARPYVDVCYFRGKAGHTV
jgi:pyruvate formate lyase activating enzyme